MEQKTKKIIISDEEFKKLIEEHGGLVRSIAKKYYSAGNKKGYTLADLYTMGLEGLFEAYLRYDSSQGAKLSTYAHRYIIESIKEGIDVKETLLKKIHRLENKARNELEIANPTIDDIIKVSNGKFTVNEIIDAYNSDPVSLDEKISDSDEEGATLLDYIADDETPVTYYEKCVHEEHYRNAIQPLLAILSSRERAVVCYYYGIGVRICDFEEMSDKIGLTKREIEHLFYNTIKKIKHHFNQE